MTNLIRRSNSLELIQSRDGGVFLIDKPLSWTSFDVVNKLRGALKSALKNRKLKVGHAGTLDPLATGLLIVCFGPYTKRINEFQDEDKVYEGIMFLGATTPSYDSETEVDETFLINQLTDEAIHEATMPFIGETWQTPPIYSAIKKDGVALYKSARAGREVEIEKRLIRIDTFKITKIELPYVSFYVKCRKGTYIRSLVYDYGKSLHSGAYLSELRRLKSGDFDVNDAWGILDVCEKINSLSK